MIEIRIFSGLFSAKAFPDGPNTEIFLVRRPFILSSYLNENYPKKVPYHFDICHMVLVRRESRDLCKKGKGEHGLCPNFNGREDFLELRH